MNGTRRLLLLVSLAAAAGAAHGADELARCAAIAAPDTRLACYDTLAHRPPDRVPTAAAHSPGASAAPLQGVASPAAGAPAGAAAVATGAGVAAGGAGGAASAMPPGAAGAAAANSAAASNSAAPSSAAAFYADPKNFGFDPVQKHAIEAGPKSMSARITNLGADQAGRTSIVLDSGERWTVFDNDGRLSAGDEVTIKRASLGSYLMMTRSNHSYRVRRIQ